MLYVLDDFEDQYHVRQAIDRPFWMRSILHRPDNDDWLLWQVNFETRVDGIDGGVDLNVRHG